VSARALVVVLVLAVGVSLIAGAELPDHDCTTEIQCCADVPEDPLCQRSEDAIRHWSDLSI
jgi:hypothetical protein